MNRGYGSSARDRSPPRSYDRRTSSTPYHSGGSSYRATADSSQPPLDRAPPLGPKAESFRGGFGFSPSSRGRGRGTFSTRPSDTWDRPDRDRDRDRDRDIRQPPPSYRSRDDDRPEWTQRDRDGDRTNPAARDARSYSSRDRSASPPRARRDSRDSIPPLLSRPSDTSSYYGASARGGLGRGRGRADWDRGRGRNSFGGERERDLFSNRSRSRDGFRDREFDRGRPSITESDRGDRYDRRDHERSRERDVRREHDIWQRDHSPGRSSTGAPGGHGTSPTTAVSNVSHYGPADRSSKMDYEMGRRPSTVITPGSLGRDRRDLDQSDYFGSRTETPRRDGPAASYQNQPAQTAAATASLDYGPPPSNPTPSSSIADKPAPTKGPLTKADALPSASASFQPPSGPKAERTASANLSGQAPRPATQQDSVARADLTPRPLRPPQGPSSSAGLPEVVSKSIDSKTDLKPPMPQTPDKSMPANVPLGPRSSLGVGFKPRQPSSEPTPNAASSSSKATPSEHRNIVIPTGPRSERETWSTTGVINRSHAWISPEYSRAKPSITNPLGRDRPSFAPTGPRSQTILQPHSDKPRIFPVPPQSANAASASSSILGHKSISSPAQASARLSRVHAASEDVEMSSPASSEDEDEFDEDDFVASEEKHRQERHLLEARKPPPLLQDPSIRNLLIRIQFLNMIMHEVIPKSLDAGATQDDKGKTAEPPPIGLPSPDEMSDEREEKPELKHPQPRGRPLRQPPVNPIPTPPIEDLPYLLRGSPKHIAFDESDDEVQHEAITTLIRQEFESAAFDWQDELQDIHTDFRQRYPTWKMEIAMLEQERRELQPSPAPASPAPSIAPSVTPSLGHERTRGARNTTEADLQAAILMSQQSLKEEEERREREAASSSQPHYDTEAIVPAMMKPSDEELNFFEDTNKLIPTSLALDVFAYVPPEDDFTEEEQLAFIQAYCQHPKKWGKIAESLPSRTYKDCITHYYLTKNEAKYKDIWRRSQPKRKRGRAATKPRSTALMSELVYDNDGDVAVAVTDTGRPRRAAAPTFGDTPGDSEINTPVPQSKRLAMGPKEANGEPVAPKPGRGRKAGGVAKPRRTKAQIQADQQAAMLLPAGVGEGSPQKAAAPQRDRARTLLRAENGAMKGDMMASPDMPRVADVDMAQYHLVDSDRLPTSMAPANNQPTSYWSVPEQQKFPQLIAYYGRDFTSIAEFMKTKTVTMIKNHYNRQIQDGKSDLEELARAADRRRAVGEPMGAPPSPAAQTKRRYEATPSTASIARPAAIQPDHGLPEGEQTSLTAKSTYTEDFPSNAVQRGLSGVGLVAKPGQARDLLREAQSVAPGQAKIEELQRPSIFGQKPLTGPRPGFFKEEPLGFGLPHQNIHEQSPHQHPLRPGESRINDLHQQSSIRGPPREPLGGASQGVPQMPITLGPTPVDKYGAPAQQTQHGRSGSLGMLSHQQTLQDARDPTSLRRIESTQRHPPYGHAPTQSPASLPAHSSIPSRSETTGSTAPTSAEQPKPAPTKRSNLMSLLNDDLPEPQQQKRTSVDSQRPTSMLSPRPVPVTSQSLSFEAARAQARPEDVHGLHRNIRGPLGQPPASQLGNLSLRDSQPAFPGSQTDQNNERWMDRFDPRPQSGQGEQRGLHQSPRVGGYSVVPPSNSHQSIRMEAQRSIDSGHPDHRRMLGQISHPGSNPSPPPQQAPQSIPPYRSLSGSSHHGRFGSTGFPQSQSLSQQSPHVHPVQQAPGPSSHPPSAGSTPVSSLHHQNRSSLDYQPQRLTIQQHIAQQQQQQQHQQHREREHEEALRRQREMEAQQQQMRMPDRDRDQHHIRHRDILGFGAPAPPSHHESQSQAPASHHHQPQHHAHNQHQHQHQQHQQIIAGIPGSRHLGFGGHSQQQHEPVPRTFTPPHPPPGAPYSAGPGPGSGLLGHGHHAQHHQAAPQHGPPQQQQQQQQQHHHHHGQGQGQGQGQPGQQGQPQGFGHGHGHGHFRGLSQGQGDGREDRR